MLKRKNNQSKRSPFLSWFERQFGPQPKQRATELYDDWRAKDDAAYSARMKYNAALQWEREHDAALKAWCARVAK